MRIGICVEWLTSYGGSEILALTTAHLAQSLGMQVLLIDMTGAAIPVYQQILLRAQIEYVPWPHEESDDVAAKTRWLEGVVRSNRCDVVHFIPAEKTAFAWLAKTASIPSVVTEATNAGPDVWWLSPGYAERMGRAHRVIAMSEVAANNLRVRHGLARVEVVPPTVLSFGGGDPQHAPLSRENAPNLCYIGRFSEEKGLEYLLAAMQFIVDRCPDAILTMYGDGPDEARLKVVAKMLGVGRYVRFAGTFSPLNKARILAEAGLVVLPSLTEGQPTCLLEAMAHRRTFVATCVGGVPELLTHNGTWASLVRPGDTRGLASAVMAYLEDVDRLADDSERAYKAFETYWHPAIISQALYQCYKDLA